MHPDAQALPACHRCKLHVLHVPQCHAWRQVILPDELVNHSVIIYAMHRVWLRPYHAFSWSAFV